MDLDLKELRRIAEAAKHGKATRVQTFGSGNVCVTFASEFTAQAYPPHNCVGSGELTDEQAQQGRHTLAEHIAAFDAPTVLALLDALEAAQNT